MRPDRRVDVAARLRGEGYRLTPQRRLVWEVLQDAGAHLTAEQIHARVTRTAPDCNLASVYRTLTVLAELQLAQQIRLGDGSAHWEVAHHDDAFHLVCGRCGGVSHHAGTLVRQVREHLADDHGFVPHDVELVVRGVCADCRTAAEDSGG